MEKFILVLGNTDLNAWYSRNTIKYHTAILTMPQTPSH